ncbi:MAG: bifunctional 5,10-methylenetetrahydrofolate dehydrogenase/5,10-methenyltetrahydrofolate cyclohydrolase [Anaerolineae bacterium]|nr:bifunctional 5,10-methylenetetrahydrofolate dehydrogenase/5,10-methenyltetrahydrofolate cyclohydrolase [Phycisphaerae bacterium]
MSAKVIDGAAIAREIKADVQRRVDALRAQGKSVRLAALLVGATPSGELYAQRQAESCQAVGIDYQFIPLPADVTQNEVKRQIRALNADASVTGIMMHLPLPPHLRAPRLQYEIDVVKDVEGVNPANIGYVIYGQTLIAPCTAMAVIELINSTNVELYGAEAVVVGASEIAGKPIALLLAEQMATVTICHIATRDIARHTRDADILVVAAGKAGLITGEHVKEGAIVIDVGINRIKQPDGTMKTMGDVEFESVSKKASYITPVPGGVGPMTVAMLLKNTLRSAEILYGG